MGFFCKTHVGSWESTEYRVFHFPTVIEFMNGSSWKQHQTVTQLSVNFPESFDPTWTFICSNDAYSYISELGLFDILRITPDLYGTKYYVSQNNYILITDRGTLQYYDAEGVILSTGVSVQSFYTKYQDTSGDVRIARIEEYIRTPNEFSYGIYRYPDSDDRITHFLDDAEGIGDDPYQQGGTSTTGGGTGTFSGTGDLISIPSLPTLSAVDAGFITLFNPSISQLGALASYMWSDLFDLDGWRKIFADPMSAILGLSIVPVAVPSGGGKTVKVGNISTGVSMTVAASQYVEVDCGTLNVQEFWGAYLDYDPYTKAEIYLPYIGTHTLSVDDIMNKSVHVVYHVDILSGACCAFVQCGGTVLYTFIGQCSSSIPITGDNWTNVVNGAISIAGSIGSMVATGGASAPMAISGIASTAINTMKPSVEKSGAMGGTGGMMGVQTPYLILTRPRQALPERQNEYTGYPSFITAKLSTLEGYTEIFKIHLENIPATEQEISEIETLLKSGVIF